MKSPEQQPPMRRNKKGVHLNCSGIGRVAARVLMAGAFCAMALAAPAEGRTANSANRVAPDEVVLASGFGWNATNATAALQAALDSGACVIVIDNVGDWTVEPVFLRSNQEVVIEDGVTVRARKGAFRGRNDCLFSAIGVTNVTLRGEGHAVLRMERDDYTDRANYCFSEWRHALVIVDGVGIRVSGIECSHSGGDGIYVGGASENIDIRRVFCHDNYRQGISVTGASNLLIADSRFSATKGTPPQCGLDFEPNDPRDRLSNCRVENCTFDGNAAHGITLNLCCLNAQSEPVSVLLRKCRSTGNVTHGCSLWVGNNVGGSPVRGTIWIDECAFTANAGRALAIQCVSRDTASIIVENTVMDDTASTLKLSGVLIDNNRLAADAANVEFRDCRLVSSGAAPAVEFSGAAGTGIESVSGTLVVEKDGVSVPFDFGALAERNRPNPELHGMFGGIVPDFTALRPVDGAAKVRTPTPWCRDRFTFLQYLPEGGEYTLEFRAKSIGGRKIDCRVQMFDRMDTDLGSFQITAAVQRVVIATPGRNLRRFEIDTHGNAVSIASPLSGQGLLADRRLNLFCENRRLYFPVPSTAENVFVEITPEEPAKATLLDVSGNPVAAMPLQTAAMTLSARHRPAADTQSSPEIWTLDIHATEDVELRLGSATTPIFAVEPTAGLVTAH